MPARQTLLIKYTSVLTCPKDLNHKARGGILIRWPNHLSYFLLTKRSSRSGLTPP